MRLGDAMDARTGRVKKEDHYLEIKSCAGRSRRRIKRDIIMCFCMIEQRALILVLYINHHWYHIGEKRGPQFQCWKTTCSPMWLLHPATFGSL